MIWEYLAGATVLTLVTLLIIKVRRGGFYMILSLVGIAVASSAAITESIVNSFCNFAGISIDVTHMIFDMTMVDLLTQLNMKLNGM